MGDACEIFNAWLKIPAANPYLGVQVKRSHHLILERECTDTIFSSHERSEHGGASEADSLLMIENILIQIEFFFTHEVVTMTDNCFWKHVKEAKKVGSERDKQKEVLPLSEYEQILHNRLCTSDFVEEEYDELEDDDYNNGNVSVVISCMGSIMDHDGIDLDEHKPSQPPDDLEQWKNLTEAEKV